MLKLWLISVIVLFVIAELCQWLVGSVSLLPIYMLAGAILAIASNSEQSLFNLLKSPLSSHNRDIITQKAELIDDELQ